MRLGAGIAQHMGFQNAFIPETGRKQIVAQYRPTPPEQVLQGEQTNLRDTQAPHETDAHRRLDGLLRPHGRLIHTRHTGRGHRLLYGKLSRRVVPASRPPMGWKCSNYCYNLPSYQSFHPTPSRTAAQPHRVQPPRVYEPVAVKPCKHD
jgi:hypothetical protein